MTDWGFYWDMVGYMRSAVGLVATGFLLTRFVRPFLTRGRRAAAVGIVYTVTMLICKFCSYDFKSMVAYAIGESAALIAMYVIDRRNIWQKIFLVVTYYMMERIAWKIIWLPCSVLYELLLLGPGMVNRPCLSFVLFILMELLLTVMHCLVIGMLIRMIHRVYRCKNAYMTAKELVLMLAPALSAVMGCILIVFFDNAYQEIARQYIEDNHSSYNSLLALYMGICFAAMLASVILYQQLREQQGKEKEDAVLQRQTEDIKRHIHELERLYLDIRSLKHDMGNHVMVLERLCGRSEEAKEYLEKLHDRVDEVFAEIKSGNAITDVILMEKSKEAAEKGIALQYAFSYPQDTDIDVFDVSVILSNALNNAIEAAQECREAYVSVDSYRKRNAYMIEIKNSMVGMRNMDGESGLPLTTKAGSGHGFGLANIRKVAQRYHGDIDIRQGEGEFVLCVMLMLE